MVFKRLEVGSTLPGISKSTCLTFRFLLLFALLLFWVFHCLCVFVCMSALSTSNEEKPTHTGTASERGIEWTSGKCMNNAGLPVMKFVFVSQRLLLPSFPAFLPLSLLSLSLPVTLTPARPTRRTTPLLLLLLLLVPRSALRLVLIFRCTFSMQSPRGFHSLCALRTDRSYRSRDSKSEYGFEFETNP